MSLSSKISNIVNICEQSHKKVASGPEVIKLFSCSIQLNTKFQLLIKTEIQINALLSGLSDVVFLMLINVGI